jgi:hypothetical protein
MQMIAAIERTKQCVWGIGHTPNAALADARKEIAAKHPRMINATMAKLEVVTLRDEADLSLDGETLYRHCILTDTPVQPGLF